MLRGRGVDGRGPAVLLAAAAIASATNFAFHALGSRLLGPVDYASLAALLALLVVVAVPVGAVQTAVTQASAASPDGTAVVVVERAARAGVVLLLFGLLGALPLDRALRLDDPWGVALTAAWAAIACVAAVAKGSLLGRLHYVPVAVALVAAAGTRVATGVVLVPWLHVEGAMLATILGEGVAACIAIAAMSRHGLLSLRAPAFRPRGTDATIALGAQLGVWLLAGVTTMVGRRVLPDAQAGDFAAASTITSAATFLPFAVAVAFFPRFAREGSRRILVQGLSLAAVLGGGVAGLMLLSPRRFVQMLAGESFDADPAVVAMLAVAAALVGCAGVAVFFLLARRRASALWVWSGAVAATIGSLVVDDARSLAFVAMSTTVLAAIVVVWAAFRSTPVVADDDSAAFESPPDRYLTVVVPTFNGGARLRPTVDALCRSLDATGWPYEVIVAVDGSVDGSEQTLAGCGAHVRVEVSTTNEGKGAALRRGFARARGELVGFIDGDGDIEVEIVRRLARTCQVDGVWAAIASKHADGAEVIMSVARRGLSHGYRALVRLLFGLEVSDTQCGAKVFTRAGLEQALPFARERGFALDVELLGLGRRLGLGRVVELPVQLRRDNRTTTVSTRDVLRTLEETLRVWGRVLDAPVVVTVPDTGMSVSARERDDRQPQPTGEVR
jgi:O-antigen/teichoic acid export membrane protein